MTVGFSPKVLIPALALIVVGAILVVLGILLKDPTLRTLGYSALGSGLATLTAGYAAPPGQVVETIGTSSDAQLPPEAWDVINAATPARTPRAARRRPPEGGVIRV